MVSASLHGPHPFHFSLCSGQTTGEPIRRERRALPRIGLRRRKAIVSVHPDPQKAAQADILHISSGKLAHHSIDHAHLVHQQSRGSGLH